MKQLGEQIKKHGYSVHSHVRQHHKKYLVGGFGIYGLIKAVILLFSVFSSYGVYWVFAADVVSDTTVNLENKEDDKFMILRDPDNESDLYGALSEFFGDGFGELLTERNIGDMEEKLFGDVTKFDDIVEDKQNIVLQEPETKLEEIIEAVMPIEIIDNVESDKGKEEKSYGMVRVTKELVRDGKEYELDKEIKKVVSFDGGSYVKFGSEEKQGAITSSGGTWDGVIDAPIEDNTKKPDIDNKNEKFIKTYSVGADVGLESDSSFDFEMFLIVDEIPGVGVGDEILGKKIDIKKSEDGDSWIELGVCNIVKTGGIYGCFVKSDTLSYFSLTYEWVFQSRDPGMFVDQAFWDTDPSDESIVYALFGNGKIIETAYNQNWNNYDITTCVGDEEKGPLLMSVIRTGVLPSIVPANHVYVISGGKFASPYSISSSVVMSDCSALIAIDGRSLITKTSNIDIIKAYGVSHVILDSLDLDGDSQNGKGIFLSGVTNWTFNRLEIYDNNGDNGVDIKDSDYGLFNGSQLYNNNYNGDSYNAGIKIYDSSNHNVFNNLHIYNNIGNGFKSEGSTTDNNVINNTQIYNNGYGSACQGVLVDDGGLILNNVMSYNNDGSGIYAQGTAIVDINDSSFYNNISYGLNNTSSLVRYFGFLYRFANGAGDTNGSISIGGSSTYAGLGWLGGSIPPLIPAASDARRTKVRGGGGIIGPQTNYNDRGYSGSRLSTAGEYIYGSFISKQDEPVYYSGSTLSLATNLEYSGDYFIGEWIGDSTAPVDTEDPETTIQTPTAGSWQNESFSVNFNDTDDTGLSGCFYRVKDDGAISVDWTGRSCGATIPIIAGTCVTEGTNKCRVEGYAEDTSGNTGSIYGRSFDIDITDPSVPQLIQYTGGQTTTSTNPYLDWNTSSDTGAGIDHYSAYLYNGPGCSSLRSSENRYLVTNRTPSVPLGTFWWKIVVRDDAGNSSESACETFSVVSADSTAPTTTIDPDGTVCQNTDILDIELYCTDNIGGVGCDSSYPKYLIIDSTQSCTNPTISYNNTPFDITASIDSYVSKKVCYRSMDTNNNLENIKTSDIFEIDKAGPTQPSVISPSNGTYFDVTNPTLQWSTSTDLGCAGFDTYELLIYNGSTCAGGTVYDTEITSNSHSPSLGADGVYSWSVRGIDGWGNHGQESICRNFTIDTQVPTLSFDNPIAQGPVCTDLIAGNWGDSTIKKWTWDSDGICPTNASSYGNFSTTAIQPQNNTTTHNGDWICLYGEDAAGNDSVLRSVYDLNIDTIAPPININNPDDSWDTSKMLSASVSEGTLTRTSASTSIICSSSRTFYAGDTTTSDSETFTSESDNGKYICYKAVDSCGNIRYSLSDEIINIDLTAPPVPTINAEPTYTSGTSNEIIASVVVDGGVGGVQYRFCYDTDSDRAGCTFTNWTTNTHTFSPLNDGQIYYYWVQSKDSLNNYSSWYGPVNSTQDDSNPTGSISIDQAPQTSQSLVDLTLSSNDTSSYVTHMRFSCNGSNWTTQEAVSNSKSNFSLTNQASIGCDSSIGLKTIYVQYKDVVGHWSISYSDTITYNPDSTPPLFGTSYIYDGNTGYNESKGLYYYKGDVDIKAEFTDAGGVDNGTCQYTINNGVTWNNDGGFGGTIYDGFCNKINVSGGPDLFINFSVEDNAGNIGYASTGVYYFDDVPPVILGSGIEFEWAKKGGGTNYDYVRGVAVDGGGNVYIVGRFQTSASFGDYILTNDGDIDVFVAKMSSTGEYLWAKRGGGSGSDYANGVAVDGGGNVYIAGRFQGTGKFGDDILINNGSEDVFVVKMSSTGEYLWAKRGGGSNADYVNGVAVDDGGNIYIAGRFQASASFGDDTLTSAGSDDTFVAKMSSTGEYLWAKRGGGSGSDYAYGIDVDSGGNAYVVGFFEGTGNFGNDILINSGGSDVFITKLSLTGEYLWAKRGGGTSYDYANGVSVDDLGNVYVAGEFSVGALFGNDILTSAGGDDIFVAKLSSTGEYLWVKKGGGSDGDSAKSVTVDNLGNIYIAGSFQHEAVFGNDILTSAGGDDIFVAKLSSEGVYLGVKSGGGNGSEDNNGIVVDDLGASYIVGRFGSTTLFGGDELIGDGGFDVFIAKLRFDVGSGLFIINNDAEITYSRNVTLNINCPTDAGVGGEQIAYGNFETPVPTSGSNLWTGCEAEKSWILEPGNGQKTVYMRTKDSLDNITGHYLDTIDLQLSVPEINTGYIFVGNTGTDGSDLYFNDVDDITIRAYVSDVLGIDTNSCEYSINGGVNRYPATYNAGGYCYKIFTTGPTNDIEINFRVQNIEGTMGTGISQNYIYDNVGPNFVFNDANGDENNLGNLVVTSLVDTGIGEAVNAYNFKLDGGSWEGWVSDPNYILPVETDPATQIVWVKTIDILGNESSEVSGEYERDNVILTLMLSNDGPVAPNNTITWTATGSDPGGATFLYKFLSGSCGGSTLQNWGFDNTYDYNMTSPGQLDVYVQVSDGSTIECLGSLGSWVDQEPPEVDPGYIWVGNTGYNENDLKYYYNGEVTIRADVSDNNELNTGSCMYNTGGGWFDADYQGNETSGYCRKGGLNPQTDIDVQFKISDQASTETVGGTGAYIYDATGPNEEGFDINGGDDYTNDHNVVLNFIQCPIDAGIGLSGLRISNNGDMSNWTEYPCNSPINNWTLVGGEGERTVYIAGIDKLGSIGVIYDDGIIVDTVSPSAVLSSSVGSWTSGSFAVTATFSEDVDDFVSGDITVNNASISNFAGNDDLYTWTIVPNGQAVSVSLAAGVVHDVSSNPNIASNTISTNYDATGPTFTFNNDSGTETMAGSLTVTSPDDSGVGIPTDRYQFKLNNGSWESWTSSAIYPLGIENDPDTDIVYVRVRDSLGNYTEDSAVYTWTNLAPIANNISNSDYEGEGVLLTADGSDPGGGGTPFSYQWYSSSNCTISIGGATNSTYTARPQPEPTTISYYYKIRDIDLGRSNCATATATWTNSGPAMNSLIASPSSTTETNTITWTANGSDPGGGTVQYEFYTGSCGGTTVQSYSTYDDWSYSMDHPGNLTVFVRVKDADEAESTCMSAMGTWSNVAPICNNVSTSVGEANNATVNATCSDGDSDSALTISWYENTNCSSAAAYVGSSRSNYESDDHVSNYSYKANDGTDDSICKSATFTWTNRLPTADNFVGHSNVGNTPRTVNWKSLSNADDPSPEDEAILSAVVKGGYEGSKGICTTSGNSITYTPDSGEIGNDTCVIIISDDDGGDVEATATWQNIDTLAPTGAPTCTVSQWFNGTLSLVCTAGDGGTKVKYTTGSSSWPSNPNSSSIDFSPHNITVTNYLKAISCDNLDNCYEGGVTTRLYQADNVGPDTTISDTNPNRRNTNVTYTLTGTDAGVGMGIIYFKTLDGADQPCTAGGYITYSAQQIISVTEGNAAQKTVCFYGVDSLGNIETPINSQTYKIDKTDPIVGAPYFYGGSYYGNYFNGAVDIQSSINDGDSGIASSSCKKDIDLGGGFVGFTSDGVNQIGSTFCQYNNYDPEEDFSIKFQVADNAGNTSGSVQSDFIYDNTGPTLNTPEIYVGTYTSTHYKEDISIRSRVNNAGVALDTSSCEYSLDNGNNWTTTNVSYAGGYCQISTNIDPGVDIDIEFKISDQLGSVGTSNTRSYVYDDTPPTTTDNGNTSWHATNQTITLDPDDNIGGVGVDYTEWCQYNDGGTPCTTFSNQGVSIGVTCSDGQVCEKIIRYRSVDNLGNTETIKSSNIVKIDKQDPSTSISPNGAICTAGDVSGVTISCNDGDGVGCNSSNIEYSVVSIGADCANETLSNYTSSFNITSSIDTYYQRKVCYRGIDLQGNAEDVNTSSNYNIDKIGPTVSNQTSPAAGYVDTTTPTLVWGAVGDQGCSTLYDYDVEIHSNVTCTSVVQSSSESSTSYTATVLTDGVTYYWRVRGVDNLGNNGNWSDCRQLSIDVSGPTGTIEINSDDDYTNDPNTTLTLDASDSNGVSEMQFSCNNSNWTSREPYSTTRSNFNITNEVMGCTTAQGTKNVSVKFKDGLGNESAISSDTIVYDITDPVVSGNNNSSAWKNSNISITLTATDNINLAGAKYRWNNSDCVNGGTNYTNGQIITRDVEGSHILYLCGEDGAGNTDTWNGIYKLDKTDPIASFVEPVEEGPELSDLISISATDAGGSILTTLKRKYNGPSQSCSTNGSTYPNTNTSWTELDESNNDDYICIYAEDGAGNYDTLVSTHNINIDITEPTGAPVCIPEGYWFSGSTVSINCTAGAGGTVVRYTTNGLTPTDTSNEWLSSQSFSSTTTLKAISCDNLNNCNTSAVEIETYTKDNTGPIVTFADNSSLESVVGILTVAGVSDAGTGLHATAPYAFSTDGGNNRGSWTSNNVYDLGIQHEPTSQTIHVKVRDKLSNVTTDSAVYTRNNQAPQSTTLSNNGPVNEGQNITWTAGGVDTGATLSYWWYAGVFCSVFLESGATNEYTAGLSNPGDLARSMKVYDSQGSGSACLTSIGTFNNQVPVCDLVSGSTGEASNLIVSIDCVEPLGGTVTGYWYTNTDCSNTQDYIGNSWTNYSGDDASLSYSYKGWDGYGFSDCTGVNLTWTNRNPTANNFTGSDSVGNTSSINVNWKTLSSANDPAGLTADPLSAVVQIDGNKGDCSIAGDTLTYQVDDNVEGIDSCTIRISDDDGGYLDVIANWGGLDTVKPSKPVCTYSQYFSGSLNVSCTSDGTIHYTTSITEPTCSSSVWGNTNITSTSLYNIIACDSYGNKTSDTLYKYILDNDGPVITVDHTPTEATNGNVTIGYTIEDYGVGLKSYKLPDNSIVNLSTPQSLVDYSTWVVGTNGSQPGWTRNGSDEENEIIEKIDPWGQTGVVWASLENDITNDGEGGWTNLNNDIDNTKKYRLSVWVRREKVGNGRIYFGLQANTVTLLGSTTPDANPYFSSYYISTIPKIEDNWLLFVGYVRPYTYSSTNGDPDAGIYNINGDKIYNIGNDFKWTSTATVGGQRTYFHYSTTTGEQAFFYRPRMEAVDGTEPSIADLIANREGIASATGEYTATTNDTYSFWADDLLGNNSVNNYVVSNIDEISPVVGKAYIYQGSTGQIGDDLFFVPIVDIRASVSDNLGISGNTCEYTLNNGLSRGNALYTGDLTDGYCYLTGVSNVSDININFRVKDVSDYLTIGESTLYLYDGGMSLLFTGVTPVDGSEISNLYFTSQIQINKDYLNNFDYIFEGTSYDIYDSGLLLMYNFDNLSALDENATTVKDLSISNNTGIVYGNMDWVADGKYGGAFEFDGIDDTIKITNNNLVMGTGELTFSSWIKLNPKDLPQRIYYGSAGGGYNGIGLLLGSNNSFALEIMSDLGGRQLGYSPIQSDIYDGRKHVVAVYKRNSMELYYDGVLILDQSITDPGYVNTHATFGSWLGSANNRYNYYMTGLMDEVRIYNYALTESEVGVLYKSNLSKYSEDNWLFTTTHDGLDYSTTYNFTGMLENSVGDVVSTGRSVTTFGPYMFFTGVNPTIGATIPYNRFETQMHIEKADIEDFDYELNGTKYDLYDSGLVLMMNMDNVDTLGENGTTVKDLSMYNNTGAVVGANWNASGKYGGAFSFAGSANYIDVDVNVSTVVTISAWAKSNATNPSDMLWLLDKDVYGLDLWFSTGNIYLNTWDGTANPLCSQPSDLSIWHNYTTIIEDGNTKLYIDGIECGTANYRDPSSNSFHISSSAGYEWEGMIDEVRIYDRALTQDEIQFMYKSNLSKYSTGDWLFTTTNTCLADNSSYAYTGHVISSEGAEYATGRVVNTDIPNLNYTGIVDFDFGDFYTSETGQVITGQYENTIDIIDWQASTGWFLTIQSSYNISGQNILNHISGSNFSLKSNDLFYYTGFNPNLDYIEFNSVFENYISVYGGPQNYVTRIYDTNDFMCNAGVYKDKLDLRLEIPGYQSVDDYIGNLYVDIVN